MNIKTLAVKVLQRNRQGNQRETQSFLANKRRKPNQQTGELSAAIEEPQWQRDFCLACGDFNNWRGCCPQPVDGCLLSQIQDAAGSTEKIKGLSIGQGIKTDDVFQLWAESGEPIEHLLEKPLWFICVAEYIAKRSSNESPASNN